MLLFYVDEAYDKTHYVLAGVLVGSERVLIVENHLASLSQQAAARLGYLDYTSTGLELHTSHIVSGKKRWKQLSHDDRFAIVEQIVSIIPAAGVDVITRAMHIPRFQSRYGDSPERLHELAFRNLMERLCERLRSLEETCLVVADEHHAKKSIRTDIRWGQTVGTRGYRGQKFDRILATIHFVDSSESRMIQLSDAVANRTLGRRTYPAEEKPAVEAAMANIWEHILAGVPHPLGQFSSVYYAQPT